MPFSRSFTPVKSDTSQVIEDPSQVYRQTLKHRLMGWLRLNSFAGKLFWMIMLGALSGVGGMAFLFSEMIKYQAEDQVQSTLDGKVNAIASVTEAAETLAYGLGISATTLHERQAQFPDTYRELTLQLFERRPEFVVGLGVGQRENGLIVDQPWLFPYYWVASSENPTDSDQTIRYEDFADDTGEFYPESDRYKDYFLPQRTVWTEPYAQGNSQLLTYYFQLLSSDGRWLGTTLVDIDNRYLSNLLDNAVFRDMGHFILLTRSGKVVADPSNAENNLKTYEEIADLKDLWPDIDLSEQIGFLEGETGYWAYAQVPEHDWFVFGYVPYAAVFNRIALITTAAIALMVALLSIAIALAIRNLNRRLRPVLNQCNQLAETDSGLLAQWDRQDDLNQLSLAFFNMLERLNLNAETIRRHEQKIEKESLHSDQVSEQFEDLNQLLSQEAGQQQALVHDVQTLTERVIRGLESIDIQLDSLNTLGRSLDIEIKRLPAHSAETLSLLEQQVETLQNALEVGQPTHQIESLAAQIIKNVLTLRAHDQRWSLLDRLHHQTSNIAQAGQVASEESRNVVESVRSIEQMLTKIEQISTKLVRRSQSVSK